MNAQHRVQEIVRFCDSHSGFLLALLTALYVSATMILVWLSHRQFRFAVETERQRNQPSVALDVVNEFFSVGVSLKNFGRTEARNIRITITPKLFYLHPTSEMPVPFIDNGVPVLAPGRELKGAIGGWTRFHQRYPDLKFTGELSYEDVGGRRYRIPVGIDLTNEVGFAKPVRYNIHDLVKVVEQLRDEIHSVANGSQTPRVRIVKVDEA